MKKFLQNEVIDKNRDKTVVTRPAEAKNVKGDFSPKRTSKPFSFSRLVS